VPAFLRPHAFASNVNLLKKRYIEDLDDWGAKQVSRCLELGRASGGEFCFGGAGCPARRKEARKCAWGLNIHLQRPERTVLSGKKFDQSRGSDNRQEAAFRLPLYAGRCESPSNRGRCLDGLRTGAIAAIGAVVNDSQVMVHSAVYLMLHDIRLLMRRLVQWSQRPVRRR
jgi:hypothetical protein